MNLKGKDDTKMNKVWPLNLWVDVQMKANKRKEFIANCSYTEAEGLRSPRSLVSGVWEGEECSDPGLHLNSPFIHGPEGSMSPSIPEVVAVCALPAVSVVRAQILLTSLSGAGDALVLRWVRGHSA